MQLMTLAQKIEGLDCSQSIWTALTEGLANVGFDHVIYNTADRHFAMQVLLTTLPELYRDIPPKDDPFLHWCCDSYETTYTGIAFLGDYPYLPAAARQFIQRAGALGFASGLAIPVRLTGSERFGGFNLGTRLDRAAFLDMASPIIGDLRLLCLLAHRRLEETLSPGRGDGPGFRSLLIAPEDRAGRLDDLTPREKEVLFLVAQGLSRKDCARLCRISVHTVSDYTKSAYRKLGLRNRAEAANLLARQDHKSR